MSEFQAGDDPRVRQPVTDRKELVRYIAEGAKPQSEWRVGTEYEKVGVVAETGAAAPFSGPRGIEALLERLTERFGWQPKRERGRIIALTGRDANITVEPGGQLELSGQQCASIHCANQELLQHINEVVTIGAELGIVFLGLGIQPVSTVDAIEWVPKRRYEIMGPYMARVGTLGQRMMKQTATVQANFDFGDELDAMRKFRVAMGLVPLVSAMFANGDYVETHRTFRQFLDEGHQGERATLEDWALHLTTLFPEVRLKRYLEVRSADSQPPHMMLALPALLKGILYEPDSLQGAWDLVRSWSWEERLHVYDAAHREGLHARIRRITLAELARELVSIAAAGLKRHAQLNERGEDERVYLDRLEELVRYGKSLGRQLAELWAGPWNRDVSRLIAHTTYRLPQ
jgi:glutamate--cysteine ligase